MKMHFPISIMEETTCSRRDLRRHCFLVLCLFLSNRLLCAALTASPPLAISFSRSTHLYSSCFLFLSCLPVKADPPSPAMCISWTDVNIWNSLMSPLEFCWCFNLISLQIHHRILFFFFFFFFFLPEGYTSWIELMKDYWVGLEFAQPNVCLLLC